MEMGINQACMIWLQRQLKNKKIAMEHAEKRGDNNAVINLMNKITVIEHLIGLIEEKRRRAEDARDSF